MARDLHQEYKELVFCSKAPWAGGKRDLGLPAWGMRNPGNDVTSEQLNKR